MQAKGAGASEVHLSLLSPQVKPRRSPFPRNPRPALPGRRLPGPPKGAPKQRSCLGGKPRARHGSGAQPALKPRVTGEGGLPDRSPLTFLILVKHRGLVGVVPAHIPPRRLPLLHARLPGCGARRAVKSQTSSILREHASAITYQPAVSLKGLKRKHSQSAASK